MSRIDLAVGPWAASVRPGIGGSVAGLSHAGIPVLRTMRESAAHPLESACFPLVPFCNRIAGGRFLFGERSIELSPNLPSQDHPLHGIGWLRAWRVVRSGAASVLLEDVYDGTGEWPWRYRAHQHIALDEAGCTLRLTVENASAEPAPMGLGLHPYFRRFPESRLRFASDAMLGIDDAFLPDGTRQEATALADWNSGTQLPDRLVDNCFEGWSGEASIEDRLGRIVVRGFGAPYCHVFAPPSGEELCIEPVSHPPDALNRAPRTVPVLPPGTAAAIALRVEIGF